MNARLLQLTVLLAAWPAVAPPTAGAEEPATQESETRPAGQRHAGREGEPLPPPDDDAGNGGDAWPWIRTFLALAVVVGLVLLARWLFRSAGGRGVVSAGGKTGPMQVLARAGLAGRHQMFLVRLGERLVLVGASPQQLTTLSEITDPAERDRLLEALGRPGGAEVDVHHRQSRTNETTDEQRQEDKR